MVSLRGFERGDEAILLSILTEAFGPFHDAHATRTMLSSNHFDQNGCLIAEENGSAVGCIAVTSVPRHNSFVVRYLAARRAAFRTEILEQLLESALKYAESKGGEYIRSTTPTIQPYVDVYRKFGLTPIRRDFRITWDLSKGEETGRSSLELRELSEDTIDRAANLYVRSSGPFWDWRTEELGGRNAVAESFKEAAKRDVRWMLAYVDDEMVGLGGLAPDYYAEGEGRFRGVFVLPKHRGKGIGRALMSEMKNFARQMDQHSMTVYTFSYLHHLAPGALLYLWSGGRIEAEYLQLQRQGSVLRPAIPKDSRPSISAS